MIVVIAGIVLGVVWAYVAPARKPKEAAPAAVPVPYTAPAPPEAGTTAADGGGEATALPDDDE